MDGTFTLRIDLGNAAMKDPWDVAAALRKTAERIVRDDALDGKVVDDNGNTVGEFEVGP